jgi:putative hemolysin
MMMLLLGRVPHTSDAADWEGWRFEIVDMDRKRIDKVLASPLADRASPSGPPPADG